MQEAAFTLLDRKPLIADFLAGACLSRVTKKYGLSSLSIYNILQLHFRFIQQSMVKSGSASEIWRSDAMLGDPVSAYPKIEQLSETIRVKDREIKQCNDQLKEFEESLARARSAIDLKDEAIRQYMARCSEIEREIGAMAERLAASDRSKSQEIEMLAGACEDLEQRRRAQEEHIKLLESHLAATHRPHYLPNHWVHLTDEIQTRNGQTSQTVVVREQQVLEMFYQGHNLATMSDLSGLTDDDIFRVLQRRFAPRGSRMLQGIDLPRNLQLNPEALIKAVRGFSFLFSTAVFDSFLGSRTVTDLAKLLTIAFDDFSHYPDREWHFMAVFVIELGLHGVASEKTDKASLEMQIRRLKSLRGQLTRRCRTLKAEHAKEMSACRLDIRDLRAQLADGQELGAKGQFDINEIISSPSKPRAGIFREMIKFAAKEGGRRYSNDFYHMAAVILFRSRSTYDYLRSFIPLPSIPALYHHFHATMKASLARLESVDGVVPYLSSQIQRHPEILEGVVLAVDAVSCSNTFVGMRCVRRDETGYLFVVYLQPLSPSVKCRPLFVIRHPSGIGDDEIQKQIGAVVQRTQTLIRRVFLASDGDMSYNERHRIFRDFWERIYRDFGLERTLTELKSYPGVLPLSDMLHLAKNFRTRFLKCLLTFTYGGRRSINQDQVRKILPLGPPLTDLSPLGKMRDIYPLVLMRVENIIALIDQGAIAEAVALLPLSLCLNAIRLETISRKTRSTLLRISFFIVWKLYDRREQGIDQLPEKTVKLKPVTVFTSQWVLRFLDTVVGLMLALETNDRLALERLATQPLENFFGFVRWEANNINTAEEMLHTIAHTDIVKDANRVLELDEQLHKRDNLGGVQIDDRSPSENTFDLEMPWNLDPETIAAICLKAVHADEGILTEGEEVAFFQFRDYLLLLRVAAKASRRDNEENHTFMLGSASRIITMLRSQRPPGSNDPAGETPVGS